MNKFETIKNYINVHLYFYEKEKLYKFYFIL